MLSWLESPSLRKSCQAGLSKSEQRHALAQVICTFKQGRIADRGHEGQQFRASGLNLVILHWNSTYLADAIAHLRAEGQPVPRTPCSHFATEMGAHRLLGRLPVGSCRRHRRVTPATQPRKQNRSLTRCEQHADQQRRHHTPDAPDPHRRRGADAAGISTKNGS